MISDENRLADMLDNDPVRVLHEQFLVPKTTQQELDTSPAGLMSILDSSKLIAVSETELEIAFR